MDYIWSCYFHCHLKWIFVETEYNFRHALGWREGLGRSGRSGFYWRGSTFYTWLAEALIRICRSFCCISLGCTVVLAEREDEKPFPYDHFIALEQNRMMRFYRFANYFTDVPHLKGSVSRRGMAWFFDADRQNSAKPLHKLILIRRTFIRTDDIFWLWVRLTAIISTWSAFHSVPDCCVHFRRSTCICLCRSTYPCIAGWR